MHAQCMRSACVCACVCACVYVHVHVHVYVHVYVHVHVAPVYMLHACALSRSKTTDELTLTTYAVGGRGGVMESGDQGWGEACK